jgi:spoIIIJ-associated protein
MKEIELTSVSEAQALETLSRQYRMPREAFEIVETRGAEGSEDEKKQGLLKIRVMIKRDFLNNLVRDRIVGLLKRMSIMAEVKVRPGDDFINVDVFTQQGSLLIGRGGQTLEAIQHLVNRMICGNDKDLPMILVDVENYQARIHRQLRKIAQRAVERVLKTNQPVKMEPMPPHERKFIHKLLAEEKGITTYSMGREGQRSVIIASEQSSRISSGEDEELLPELLDDPTIFKTTRSGYQRKWPAQVEEDSEVSDGLREFKGLEEEE